MTKRAERIIFHSNRILGGAPDKLKDNRKLLEFKKLLRETRRGASHFNFGGCIRFSICLGHHRILRPKQSAMS